MQPPRNITNDELYDSLMTVKDSISALVMNSLQTQAVNQSGLSHNLPSVMGGSSLNNHHLSYSAVGAHGDVVASASAGAGAAGACVAGHAHSAITQRPRIQHTLENSEATK